MTLFYPDVSNNNWDGDHNNVVAFLSQLQAQGFAGVAHKVTQGSNFVDEFYMTALQWCLANGFPIIGYHYVDTSDPEAQAENWRNAKGTPNAMLDFERGSGTMDNFWAVTNAFNGVGTNVQLAYDPRWYLNSSEGGYGDLSGLTSNGIRLVSSTYPIGYTTGSAFALYDASGGDEGSGWDAYNGAVPEVWQFTSTAIVSGRNNVDVNAYKGTDIRALFGG